MNDVFLFQEQNTRKKQGNTNQVDLNKTDVGDELINSSVVEWDTCSLSLRKNKKTSNEILLLFNMSAQAEVSWHPPATRSIAPMAGVPAISRVAVVFQDSPEFPGKDRWMLQPAFPNLKAWINEKI